MRAVAYLLGLACSLPLLAFALGVLALGHVIETRNVFVLLYHFALAFVWGLPLLLLALVVLLGCAFARVSRLAGSAALVLLNVAALVVVLRATGLPRTLGDGAFLGPTLVALFLQGRLLFGREAKARPAAAPGGAGDSAGPPPAGRPG